MVLAWPSRGLVQAAACLLFLSSPAAAVSRSSPSPACSCNDLAACRNVGVGTLTLFSARDHDDFHHVGF